MRKIAAVDRTVPAVSRIDLSDVRSRQSAGVLWSARGWGRVAVCGVGRVRSRGQRKQLWLGACRVKNQLQPQESPRRIYNARVRVMEWFRFNSTSGTFVVSGNDTEILSAYTQNLSVYINLSVRSGSLNGHPRTIVFETATPMPHASGRSPRGDDRHGTNHTSSRALCVELSEIISAPRTGSRDVSSSDASGKSACQIYFQVE